MRRRLAAVLVAPLLLAACSGQAGIGVKVEGPFGERPTVTFPKAGPGAAYVARTLVDGKGAQVHKGDLVIADYTGYTWGATANRLIGTSYAGGAPSAFPSWQLVPGLERAVTGSKVGSRVVAVIPPKDGYGDKGAPELQIGGSDSLVYVLDVRGAYPASSSAQGQAVPLNDPHLPQVGAAGPGQAPQVTVPHVAAPATLQVRQLIKGAGQPVRSGQVLAIQYSGYIWRTGQVFDSSWTNGHVFSTVIGRKQVVDGWDQGLVGQPVGSRVLLVIPPSAGYGDKGLQQVGIKGDDTIVYVVDILGAY
jgi:FKBP-type peptidyl-prolyl cis-trans isomerase